MSQCYFDAATILKNELLAGEVDSEFVFYNPWDIEATC